MMLSKYAPLIAVVVIALMIVPQYAAATSSIQNTTIIDATSAHDGLYDTQINLATNSSTTNADTWNPAYEGIYMGSSTEESLFQFNDITSLSPGGVASRLYVATEMQLSSKDVMNGVSSFTIRLPFYFDAGVVAAYFEMYAIPSSHCYNINLDIPATGSVIPDFGSLTTYHWVCGDYMNMTGTPITSLSYIIDNRGYMKFNAPLIPNQLYLLFFCASYVSNGAFKMYWSPNDVMGDGIVNTTVCRYIAPTILDPITYHYSAKYFNADAGFSFDMVQGIGGSMTSFERYLYAGQEIQFGAYCQGAHNTNGYQSVMIPFFTTDNTLNVSIEVQDYASNTLFTVAAKDYNGYILAVSAGPENVSNISPLYDYLTIILTMEESKAVEFLFHVDSNMNTAFNYTTIFDAGYINWVFMPLYSSYIVSSNQPVAPIAGAITAPAHTTFSFVRQFVRSPYGLAIVFSGMVTFSAPLTAAALLFPKEYTDAVAIGAQIVGFANWGVIGSAGVTAWEAGYILPNLNVFQSGTVSGILNNFIDSIWGGLSGIGHWIQSVGEYVYNSLVWLGNAIVEYGSIILGLLAIFIIIIIFFFVIWFQLKLWGIGLRMAEGDWKGASKEGQELASTVEKGVGKVI